jgi:hypothetical protein
MALKDFHKSALNIKSGLFAWTIMPLGMKKLINTFFRTMIEVFGIYLDKFFKVFVNDINVHNMTSKKHLEHLCYVLL